MFYPIVIRARVSSPVALLMCALLFAAVHPIYAIPGVFLLAVFLGLLTYLLGNLSYSILAHAAWNLANLLVLKLTPDILDPELESPFAENAVIWLPLSLALFLFFSRLWFRHRD